MKKFTKICEDIDKNKKELEFLKTGISLLDNYIDGGFLRKELVVLGGQSGSGKSYVAGSIFKNIAFQGFNSAYFSLEISSDMVVSRLIGSETNIKPINIMIGNISPQDKDICMEVEAGLSANDGFMSFYDDIYELEKIKEEIKINSYEFVVIDFIQNIIAKGEEEYSRLSYIALELQKTAKELNCCILVLSQLSNSMAREKHDSVFLEYKGSGSIATVCDLGTMITRGEILANGDNQLFINIRKNRRGMSGQAIMCTFSNPGGRIT